MDKFRSSGVLQLITLFISLISLTTIVITNSIYQREVRRAEAQVSDSQSLPTTHYPSPTTHDLIPTAYNQSPTSKPSPTTHYSPPNTQTPTPTVKYNPSPTTQYSQPTSTPAPTPTTVPPTGNYQSVYVTYYGWPDNDPSGTAIAYPAGKYPTKHTFASGVGTYDDPVTFASDGTFSVGQIVYVPYIKKYAMKEDLCATCSGNHIDIWMESDASYESQLIQCQRHWTRSSTQIEINPPSNRTVEYTYLFNKTNGQCLN